MNDDIVSRLKALDSCAVSDALDSVGHAGVLLGLTALSINQRVVGRAITVKLGADDGRETKRHLGTAAIEAGGPDSIILVGHQGRADVAGWGGILSLAANVRGIAGVVVDGASRDIDEARDLRFPIYGRCGVPRTARGRVIELDWNCPIEMCAIQVLPGDFVIADGSGVVVVPQKFAKSVIETAERIVAKEKLMAEAVRSNKPVSQVMGSSYEDMLKQKTK